MVLAACGREPPPPPADLATHLAAIDDAAGVARMKLDEPTWRRIVVEPYDALYPAYARAFDEVAPAIAERLAGDPPIATRRHYAGDPGLTTGEAWARWALPVAFGSEVATAGGVELDAVFLRDRGRWLAIAGLDRVIRARVAALDPACAARLDAPARRCRELAWQITDAALRTTPTRFSRACALAATHCGKRSPP